jgi:hypothetical protein
MSPPFAICRQYRCADALSPAARDSRLALCATLHHAGQAHIEFRGLRFRCRRVAGDAVGHNMADTVRVDQADFLHMTFLQALARVFALIGLQRLTASLQRRISKAEQELREVVADGLRLQRQALTERVVATGAADVAQAGEERAFVALMTELESLHGADATFRDASMIRLFRTLVARAAPLPVAILDDIRRTVWSVEASTALQALRNDLRFRQAFVRAALRTSTADRDIIDRGLQDLGAPHAEANDPGARFRANALMGLLQVIGRLPRELIHDHLMRFEAKGLQPLLAQLAAATDPGHRQALLDCTRRVAEELMQVRSCLEANPANFLTGKSMPPAHAPRRWGRPAATERAA